VERVGFVLKVRADRLEDYRREHENVWPEMLEALSRHGWHNYSLFLRHDGTLIGYVEAENGFQAALDGMADEEVNARWQDRMAPFFEGGGDQADTMMEQLEEVFHLD
jgi:L-rhamnose mutarotase